TDTPHSELLGLTNPLSSISYSCTFNPFNSISAIWYGVIKMGLVPRKRSIPNSISFSGGKPDNFSRNTSENSFTIDNCDKLLVSTLMSLICAKYPWHPFLSHL